MTVLVGSGQWATGGFGTAPLVQAPYLQPGSWNSSTRLWQTFGGSGAGGGGITSDPVTGITEYIPPIIPLFDPLAYNVPIVDPATGNPTPYFQNYVQKFALGTGLESGPTGKISLSDLANHRVLGRNSSGVGEPEEVSVSQLLDWIGNTQQGDILYRGALSWERLGAGTSGQFLKTLGAAANPLWAAVSGVGNYTYTQPPFANVSALLHFDGPNSSTTITDGAGGTWTAVGAAVVSTAQSVFGGSSLFVPSGTNSSVKRTNSSAFDVAAGDWSVEFRWRYNGAPETSARVFTTRDGDTFQGITLNIDANSVLSMAFSSTGASYDIASTTTIGTLRQSGWTRVIVQRRGIFIEAFLDNALAAWLTIREKSIYYNAGDLIVIGGNSAGTSRSMNAYMDEFRFTKGVAVMALNDPGSPTIAFPDN